MTALFHLSLISGLLPTLLVAAAATSLGVAVLVPDTDRLRTTALLALLVGAVVVVAGMASGIEHKLGSSFPHSFYLWAGLPLFAAAVTIVCWRRSTPVQRMAAAAAILFCLALGADQVDRHYAYLPTVGDLLGRPVEDQVALGNLTAHSVVPAAAPTVAPEPENDHGRIVTVAIPGTVSGFHARPALVWLPPAYFRTPRPNLPVIVLLAGVPGDPTNMVRAGHANRPADAYAASHGGMAPILVFPDQNGHFTGDTECVDGPRGNAETYLTTDVPSFVQTTFSSRRAPGSWAIVGFSEGGTCADTLALRHPELFGAFVDIAGELHPSAASGPHERALTIARLYGGDARQWRSHDPAFLARRARRQHVAACYVAGTADRRAVRTARWLDAVTRGASLPSALQEVPGTHSFGVVERTLTHVIPALADALDAGVGAEPACGHWSA